MDENKSYHIQEEPQLTISLSTCWQVTFLVSLLTAVDTVLLNNKIHTNFALFYINKIQKQQAESYCSPLGIKSVVTYITYKYSLLVL
jgi:hypothetical protein